MKNFFFQNYKIILSALFLFAVFSAWSYLHKNIVEERMFDAAINNGVDFLYQKQYSNGEFSELSCKNEQMTDCSVSRSLFSTSSVLYSISAIKSSQKVPIIMQKGIKLFQDEKFAGALWSYYGKNSKNFLLPDMDDSAVISLVFKKNGQDTSENIKFFEKNRNGDNLFYTWFNPLDKNSNDIDCAVNANILMYLQKNDEDVCRYVNENIMMKKNCSPYYPDKLALYYIISRAVSEGVGCFNEGREVIVSDIANMQKSDGSFGSDIQNAFAVNALLNFDYDKYGVVEKGLKNIMKKQSPDGSWNEGMFWSEIKISNPKKYGSRELTTALSLEALNK